MTEISRRSFLRAVALGGAVIAGELWIPGQKLISIPKSTGSRWDWGPRVYYGYFTEKNVELICKSMAASLQATKEQVAARVFSEVFNANNVDVGVSSLLGETTSGRSEEDTDHELLVDMHKVPR